MWFLFKKQQQKKEFKFTFPPIVFCCANRSSYPDRKEGEDAGAADEELPDDKTLEYDDETLELTLPSGDRAAVLQLFTTS